jgi:threonine dehydrogenase-like Zn-dependent dehydrogenase
MKRTTGKKINTITRRQFLKSSAVTAAALTAPIIVPSSVFGANAPSNRVTIGSIGLGGMGTGNMKGFKGKSGSQVVALCDVDAGHLEKARQTAELDEKSTYNDFRELLARDDIDAVVVATPDHWHVPISIAAVKAGKDVYCEKPLTLTIAGGRALADSVKRYGRVLQTGSQQRSGSEFRNACELVRNGRIFTVIIKHVRRRGRLSRYRKALITICGWDLHRGSRIRSSDVTMNFVLFWITPAAR